MNLDNVHKDVAKELFTVLSYCDDSFIKNIPEYIFDKINQLSADSLKEVYVDRNKNLMEQDVSDDCKELLAELYFIYMTDSTAKKGKLES